MARRSRKKKATVPEWLISTDEYLEAPIGTIVAREGAAPFYKACMAESCPDEWEGPSGRRYYSSGSLSGVDRRVLRWGRG